MAADVLLPNLMIRRLEDVLEVSWDNETWGTARRGLMFVEQRGTEFVNANLPAVLLREALQVTVGELARKYQIESFRQAEAAVAALRARPEDWKWLVHPDVARIIRAGLPALAARLDEHTRTSTSGWYIPHATETLALRQAHLSSSVEIDGLLNAVSLMPRVPVSERLRTLMNPTRPALVRPWLEGHERAAAVRDALSWGVDPLPDLTGSLGAQHVLVRSVPLAASVALVSARTPDCADTTLNPKSGSRLRREIGYAGALGHLLLDVAPVGIEGTWEYWPTAPRARSLGVMLLMPIEGVRDALQGRRLSVRRMSRP